MQFIPYAGGKIAADGAYDGVPMDAYHGDLCVVPSVSRSGLWTIENRSPAHYYAESYLNPDRAEQEQKAHFNLGGAAHYLYLREATGSAGFVERYAVRPAAFKDWRTDAAKAWRDEQVAAGKAVLVPDDLEVIEGIARQIACHPIAGHLLTGHVEKTLVWKDPTGVWLKSRPDVIPTADGVVADLKVMASAKPSDFGRSIRDHGYHLQAAMTSIAMHKLFGVKVTDFVFVVAEKSPPYPVSVIPLDPDWIYWGRRQLRRAVNTFARCVETGEWPGYPPEQTAYIPRWAQTEFEREDEIGALPKEGAW
jgi:hypothetical protein